MYPNFNDLHRAYGFQDGNRTRDNLSLEEERNFVRDCFETYEHIGFADTFASPYESEKKYNGMKFSVIGRVKEIAEDQNGADLECLPMWSIRLENGDTINAYPEEICVAERS